jgi:hypothetical protein
MSTEAGHWWCARRARQKAMTSAAVSCAPGAGTTGAHPGVEQCAGEPQDPLAPLFPGEGPLAEGYRDGLWSHAGPVVKPVA